ncbi:ribonuclease H-like domain-containing protein [Tanacetum coccineum]
MKRRTSFESELLQIKEMVDQDIPPPTITAIKIAIIKKGEYDIWSMRMRQYICHTDHNLWDIIVNGDLEDEATPSGEQSSPPVPKTAKQLAARKNQERIKIILLLAILMSPLSSHNFENFVTASNKTLDKAYDRFQKLISQLEIHEAYVSKEDINQKFLRSLSPSWSQIALIMRIKPVIDEWDFGVSCTPFLSQLQTVPQLENEDFQQMDGDDLEELDLRWQVAMLTVRVKKFIQRTGRNMDFKEKRPVSLDKSKIKCYNYHRKGHFTRECRSGRSQGRRPYGDRSNAQTTESSSQALVAQDGLGGYDWSNDFEVEPVNYALMAISSSNSSSSSDTKLEIRGYEIALESLEARILGHEKNELAWGERYEFQNYDLKCREIKINNLNLELEKVVKERDELKLKIEKWEGSSKNLTKILNRNSLTPRPDISFAGLDEYAFRNKIIESESTELTRLSISTVRPVYTVRPVSTARPLASKIAQSKSVIRPNHPRLDIVRPKASNSPIKRSYVTQLFYRPKDLKPDVKTFGIKNMTIVGTRVVVSKGKVENVLKKDKWAYHSDYEDLNGGFVAIGSDPKGVASIDSKEYIITEASVRSQLQLADATGIHNLSDAKIFAGLAAIGVCMRGSCGSRINSLEKELKDTKHTLGNVVLRLVKKVKSLEKALKRKSKKVLIFESEGEESEDHGRKIQDIDDDPLGRLKKKK